MPDKKTPPRLPPRPRPTGRPNPGIAQPRPEPTPLDERFRGKVRDPRDEIEGFRDPDETNMTTDGPTPDMPRDYKMRKFIREKGKGAAKPPISNSPMGTPAPRPSPRPMPTPSEPLPPSQDPKQSSMRLRQGMRRRLA